MADIAARNPNRCPSHPGELLTDLLADISLSKVALAGKLGISRQHLYDLLNAKKPISPTIATRLGKLFGDGTGVWLRMQAAHDAWVSDRDDQLEVKQLVWA